LTWLSSGENAPEESGVDDDATKRALEQSIRTAALADHLDEAEAAWQLYEQLSEEPALRE